MNDEVEQERLRAIWGKPKRPKVGIHCQMQAAYEKWKAEGNTGTFSIMLSCNCPKCTHSM